MGDLLELFIWICIIVAIASFWGSSSKAQNKMDQMRRDNNKWEDK